MEFYIAQIISALAVIIIMISLQIKNIGTIFALQLGANVLSIITYILLDGLSGAGICVIAIIQLLVMYIYDKLGKEKDNKLIVIFVILYTIVSLFNFKSIIDIFPLTAAVLFAIGVGLKDSKKFRTYAILSPLCWGV